MPRGREGLARRWESLGSTTQAAVVGPPAFVLLFLVNLGPFSQPLWRSLLYGVIEALPVVALVLVATANEKKKREAAATRDRDPEDPG